MEDHFVFTSILTIWRLGWSLWQYSWDGVIFLHSPLSITIFCFINVKNIFLCTTCQATSLKGSNLQPIACYYAYSIVEAFYSNSESNDSEFLVLLKVNMWIINKWFYGTHQNPIKIVNQHFPSDTFHWMERCVLLEDTNDLIFPNHLINSTTWNSLSSICYRRTSLLCSCRPLFI